MPDPRGPLSLHLVRSLEAAGIPSVYLRNYEGLPDEVGNDVDLLISKGKQQEAIEVFTATAASEGWMLAGVASFGEVALYFLNPKTGESLHIDLYKGFFWRFLEFADADGVISRRRWNGMLYIPDPKDELYLNVCERLIHHGKIRDHHAQRARDAISLHGDGFVTAAFSSHLGGAGIELADSLIKADWNSSSSHKKSIRSLSLKRGLKHPVRLVQEAITCTWRIAKRFVNPPGRFIVLEGADGVGKSTVLEEIVPWGAKWCAGRTPHVFHWKPVKLKSWPLENGPSVDPRGKQLRSPVKSLLFLAYHIFGFWKGWLLGIYPLLVKSHLVVGDRYSYDLFLDPARFRLNLPRWICKVAAMVVPQPDLAICLIADPEVVHARKPELEPEEIASYQEQWRILSESSQHMVSVTADGPVEEVILEVKRAIITRYLVDTESTPIQEHP